MPDVITFGELLIDFVPTISGVSLAEAPAFIKAPGGAPANVAVGLARLGVPSGFMGMVGTDPFGNYLAHVLTKEGVDISNLRFTNQARTMLAFVSLKADGERDFMFYRHPSADMLYSPADVDPTYLKSAHIFHHGSISLISEPSHSATLYALEIVHKAGLIVSFDPNIRLNLWPDEDKARKEILNVWGEAHVVKASEEEVLFLSGESSIIDGVRKLWGKYNQLVIVTLGKRGCAFLTVEQKGQVSGFDVQVVDTTGAGDGFVAGLLHGILESSDTFLDEVRLKYICQYANAVGALTTQRKGAIPALPTNQEVQAFLSANSK